MALILKLDQGNAIVLKVAGTSQIIGTIRVADPTKWAILSFEFPKTIDINRTDMKKGKPDEQEVT
jgi:hypothetical protein